MATNLLKSIDDALELYWKVTWRRNQQLIEKTVERLKKVKERLQNPNVINDIRNASIDANRTKAFPYRNENYKWVMQVNDRVSGDWATPTYDNKRTRQQDDVFRWYDAPYKNMGNYSPTELTRYAYPDEVNPWWYLERVDIPVPGNRSVTLPWWMNERDSVLVRNPITWKRKWLNVADTQWLADWSSYWLEKLLEDDWKLGEQFKKDFESWKYLLTGNVNQWFQFAENPWTTDIDINSNTRRGSWMRPGATQTIVSSHPYWYYKSSYPEWWSKNERRMAAMWPEKQYYYQWDINDKRAEDKEYNEQAKYLAERWWLTPLEYYNWKDFDTQEMWMFWNWKVVPYSELSNMTDAELTDFADKNDWLVSTWDNVKWDWPDVIPEFAKEEYEQYKKDKKNGKYNF